MPIDFYYTPGSPPCRLVAMVASTLSMELTPKIINMSKGDNLTPEFLKINPQHTIPTIVDDGFAVYESRAISRYLIAKYGENTSLYPKDLNARTIVDQRVDFDMGTLYPRARDCYWPLIIDAPLPEQAVYNKLYDSLEVLNTHLEGQEYLVGSGLTLADIVLVTTVSTIDAADIVDLKKYPNVYKWYELMQKTIPNYEETNSAGITMMRGYIAQKRAARKD